MVNTLDTSSGATIPIIYVIAAFYTGNSVSLSGFTALIRGCCRRGMGLHHRLIRLHPERLHSSATLDVALSSSGLLAAGGESNSPGCF